MGLYFSNESYLNKALELAKHPPASTHSFSEALILAFSFTRYGQVDYLCERLSQKLEQYSPNECFNFLRGISFKENSNITCKIWECAQEILSEKRTLGSEVSPISGRNVSHLWGHLLLEAKVAGQLAEAFGLDKDTARKLGILHDIGRTSAGTEVHGIHGFEILTDLGWDREALGCLTHSFLSGGRCTNLEPAINGFYIDEKGNAQFEDYTEKDDISTFLENYYYGPYDDILNIADLMAASSSVLSPAERVADIMTRRPVCLENHVFFLAELTNMLRIFRKRLSHEDTSDEDPIIKADSFTSEETIRNEFNKASDAFYAAYNDIFSGDDSY